MKLVPIEKLVPYANNARTHSAEQINKIRSSLREFGFVNPVLIDRNYGIIAGHGRVMAAKAEQMKEVPCVFVDGLSKAQQKAYILADNRLALEAGWDEELLKIELENLKELDFDISFTGFDDLEIEKYLEGKEIEIKPEEDNFDIEAELEKPSIAKVGDIWTLGRHRIICGDATEEETYRKLLGKEKVELACIDPPYFVKVENESGKIKNDDLNDADGYKFLKKALEKIKNEMKEDASIYMFYAAAKTRIVHDAYEDAGFKVGAGLVWKKNQLVLTRTDWKYIHEPIIFGWKVGGKHKWYGDQKQTTVFEFARIKDSQKEGYGHPTSKPIALIEYLIKQSTKAKDTVLDSFLGSATTLIACEQLERTCYGAELEPKYVDVAIKRYAELTGKQEEIEVEREGRKIKYKDLMN